MRQLNYDINLKHFMEIKDKIVPAIFTEHQFALIEKKFTNEKMTDSEKNEFSRAISKKMTAINSIMEKETGNVFVYGQEKIRNDRLRLATIHLKIFSRKFKNKHVIISGSFLYYEKYNDIDIFVISKYEKEDYYLGEFHINYLTEDVYGSLFFAGMKKLCVSNKRISYNELTEKINLDTFISLYQELFNDLDRKFEGIKTTIREFLMQSAFISKAPIPDSFELKEQLEAILALKKQKEAVKKLFINAVIIGIKPETAITAMKEIISSYKDIMHEYKQHKSYYLQLTEAFNEVILLES